MAVNSELQGVLDSLPEPRLLIRNDFTVAHANTAFRKRFGIEDYAGRHCHEILFHDLRPCSERGCICPLERCLVTNAEERTLRRESVPGGERFIDLCVAPVQDSDGTPTYFLERVIARNEGLSIYEDGGIVSKSQIVKDTLEAISRVTAYDYPVVFYGPSGCGKKSFARLLHENSSRAAQAFITIHCEGLTEALFDDEFFGVIVGSQGERMGGISAELGATVYFEGIEHLSKPLQRRVLELLETGMLRSHGELGGRAIDCRLVFGCSESLDRISAKNLIRQDLMCRLAICAIEIPPLSKRKADIPELAALLLRNVPAGRPQSLSQDALDWLMNREWPGNVRELESVLLRTALFADGEPLTKEDFERCTVRVTISHPTSIPEGELLLDKVNNWKGSKKELAQVLGISERTLYRLLKEAKCTKALTSNEDLKI